MFVYYLTRDSTRAFNLLTRAFSLLSHGFELVTREFELVTREFELVTRGFELVTRNLCFTFPQYIASFFFDDEGLKLNFLN